MYKNSATARLPLSLWNAIVARSLATSVRRSRPVDEVSREARRDLVSPLTRRSVMGAARDRAHADILHDVLDDFKYTKVGANDLFEEIIKCEYSLSEADTICANVMELTDKYTKNKYPNLNRKERKILEANRVFGISRESKIVKCADIMDNCKDIVDQNPKFAKTYLLEKVWIVSNFHDIYGTIMQKDTHRLIKEQQSRLT